MQELRLAPGMDQGCAVDFDLNFVVGFELQKPTGNYYPLIISINYQDAGQPYAMILYASFTLNGQKEINGVKIVKQLVLIKGMPFELKTIYGMVQEHEVAEGEANVEVKEDDSGQKECLVCLDNIKDTVIMPCGHLCICMECGPSLVKAKHTCPICRSHIATLIPMKGK